MCGRARCRSSSADYDRLRARSGDRRPDRHPQDRRSDECEQGCEREQHERPCLRERYEHISLIGSKCRILKQGHEFELSGPGVDLDLPQNPSSTAPKWGKSWVSFSGDIPHCEGEQCRRPAARALRAQLGSPGGSAPDPAGPVAHGRTSCGTAAERALPRPDRPGPHESLRRTRCPRVATPRRRRRPRLTQARQLTSRPSP